MGALDGRAIAFIGLGLMGRPMARHLHAAGARVIVHNRSPGPQEDLAAEGMTPADGPAEAARAAGADTVITMVTDTPSARKVLVEDGGVLDGIAPGALVIDMGTTQVMDTREMAARFAEAGADYVDAPVSGGQVGAEQGALTIMVGGARGAVERAWPLFAAMGQHVTHVGDVGAGQIAKSANQMIVGLTLGAVGEALALAARAGADPGKVREALSGGFADSRILELHGQRMIDRAFTPGGRVSVQRKDVAQALALAEAVGLDLPGLSRNRELWDRMIEAGWQDLDHSAIVKAIDPDW